MRQQRHRLVRTLVAVAAALVIALAAPVGAGAHPTSESSTSAGTARPQLRALWVDAFGQGLYTPAQIDDVIQTAIDQHLNTVIAHVVWAGDCLCNRSSLPRADIGLVPAPFDPLEYIIERGHAAGLQVHAWINSTPAWRGSTSPRNASHVYNQHGPTADGDDYWLTSRFDGETKAGDYYILDVGHPATVDHIVDAYTSIAANYDVDGVNIDRIRQPSFNSPEKFVPSWGYNPVALRRFHAATGRTDRPAPGDAQWKDWRREQLTSLVRRIYLGVHAVKPKVAVSADTIVWDAPPAEYGSWEKAQPYDVALQDWRGWLDEGILDLNVPMLYLAQHNATARAQFEGWNEYIKDHQYERQAAIGVGLYENYTAGNIEQARTVLAPSAAGNMAVGWVGYSWRNTDIPAVTKERPTAISRAELTRALTQPSEYDPVPTPVFADRVATPEMPWKQHPTLGHLSGSVRAPSGAALDQLTVKLSSTRGGRVSTTHLTDGSGWFGFANLTPGTYILTLDHGRVTGRTVWAFRVTRGQQNQVNLCAAPSGTESRCAY